MPKKPQNTWLNSKEQGIFLSRFDVLVPFRGRKMPGTHPSHFSSEGLAGMQIILPEVLAHSVYNHCQYLGENVKERNEAI